MVDKETKKFEKELKKSYKGPKKSDDTRCAIVRLFDDGAFEHILVEIFSFFDGPTLECCALVSTAWRTIVLSKQFRPMFFFKFTNSLSGGVTGLPDNFPI